MYTDQYGKTWVKLAFHQHSTCSDGRATPEEIANLYRKAGYDAVALTDHWVWRDAGKINGMPILSGCEYHTPCNRGGTAHHDGRNGVYHIVALCCDREPDLKRETTDGPQQVIDAIHAAGGLAILGHPAWSFNTPEQILKLRDIDAVEIFNTNSVCGNNRRGDSSDTIDQVAVHGDVLLPISGADDSHRYNQMANNRPDYCATFVMAECEDVSPESIKQAIRERRFYTSQGPEICLSRKGNRFVVDSSPVSEIAFFSNLVVDSGAVLVGKKLTHFEYETEKSELHFIRARVTDAKGRMAWSQYIRV